MNSKTLMSIYFAIYRCILSYIQILFEGHIFFQVIMQSFIRIDIYLYYDRSMGNYSLNYLFYDLPITLWKDTVLRPLGHEVPTETPIFFLYLRVIIN